MIRRRITLFVVAAMIALPQLGNALPREECLESYGQAGGVLQGALEDQKVLKDGQCIGATESKDSTGYTTVQTLSVPSTGSLVLSTSLTQGLQYQLKVSGTWRYSSNNNHLADTAFTTADGWSSASKNSGGRSLEVNGIRQSNTSLAYSATHVYKINHVASSNGPLQLRIYDENYSDGNSGSLSVEILRAHRVTYVSNVTVPVGVGNFNQAPIVLLSTSTVPSPVPLRVPVGPYTVPGTPTIVTLKGYPNPAVNGYCFAVHNSSTGDLPAGGVCLPNLINYQQPNTYPLYPKDPTIVCASNSCDVSQTAVTVGQVVVPGISLPDQYWNQFLSWAGPRPFKPGSGIQVTVEWQADRDHLYIAASGPGGPNQNGVYQPFNTTNPSEINWFLANRDRLAAKINVAILFEDGTFGPPDGEPDPSSILPGGIVIPGLGQFIEAAFSSRVADR